MRYATARNYEEYAGGKINQRADGLYDAAYLNRRTTSPYLAIAANALPTLASARAAIDAANSEQEQWLARFTALDYEQARQQGQGATWPKPVFWGETEVLTVVHVGKHYIISIDHSSAAYLSMGNADYQYVCASNQVEQFVRRFEAPLTTEFSCHYCGMPAIGFGFFDEPVCRECGG